jgi:hypothetical protein
MDAASSDADTRYFAVRQCDGVLDKPAIFFDKNDMLRVLVSNTNKQGATSSSSLPQYQEFTRMVEAMQYIYSDTDGSPGKEPPAAAKRSSKEMSTSGTSASAATPTAAKKQKKTRASTSSDHLAKAPPKTSDTALSEEEAAKEEEEWLAMFLQLETRGQQGKDVEYVSYLENPDLSMWLRKQLNLYRAIKHGKAVQGVNPVKMSQRFLKLQEIGYNFETHKKNPTFEEMAHMWHDYYQKHGSDPTAENPLNKWVNRVRKWYIKFQNGEKTRMKQEDIDLLTKMNFRFTTEMGSKLMGKSRPSWDQRFEELLEYKRQNGNCAVPIKYGGPGGLGPWVLMQRKWYRDLQKDPSERTKNQQRSFLTDEKIEKLKSIGFSFSMIKDTSEVPWHERFQQLVEYKEAHGGSINVSNKVPGLGPWMFEQKKLYREDKLSDFHKKQLESIGFGRPVEPPPKVDHWYENYHTLVQYKKYNGTTSVERSKAPALYAWCCHQRIAYHKLKKGETKGSSLTDGKIAVLNDIGFDWEDEPQGSHASV